MRFVIMGLIALTFAGSAFAECEDPDTYECMSEAARLIPPQEIRHGWYISCHPLSRREWSCSTWKSRDDGRGISISHDAKDGFCFSAGYSTESTMVRIGDNPVLSYSGYEVCGATAQAIIEQLKTEHRLVTRTGGTTFEIDSKGFNAAFDALSERIFNPRP